MKFQGRLPVILSFLMLAMLIVLSYFRISELEGTSLILTVTIIALYGIWLAVEGKVAANEISKGETNVDNGTLEIYAASRGLTVLGSLAAQPLFIDDLLKLVGLLVFVFGVLFRLFAIRTLGEFYSHRVRIADEHLIIKNGPYRLVRHPAYTGMFLAHFGFVLFFLNWVGVALLLGLLLPAIIFRILHEEKALMSVTGYREYSRGVKRLIPVIW